MLIRRRGQRQARHARKGIHHRAQQAVIWAEIMPPLRYAMRLVDGEKADVGLFQHVAEMRLAGPFRRDIEQVQIAIDQGTDGCPGPCRRWSGWPRGCRWRGRCATGHASVR
jgi:hypothetical protein